MRCFRCGCNEGTPPKRVVNKRLSKLTVSRDPNARLESGKETSASATASDMLIRKYCLITSIALAVAITCSAFAADDPPASLVASAKGEGTIKLGKEEYKLNAVVVKLFADGKAELNLITDITVFITGTWSRENETAKTIDLKITSSVTGGNLDGGGKIFLTDDRKSISGLKLQLLNKVSRKTITAEFVAK